MESLLTTSKYHFAVRWVKNNKDNIRNGKLSEYLLQNSNKDFWNLVSTIKGKSHRLPNVVDNAKGSREIREIFKDKYESLYNCVSYDASKINEIEANVNHLINNTTKGCCNSHIISVQAVKRAVKKLKAGKSDGVHQSMSDYLINASERFYVLLSMVLYSLIVHGIVPDEMSAGTIVPIIKNKRKSVNDSSNYTSVALSSIVGKIIDNVILTKFQHQLKCSDYQFGFRQNHSTTKCTFVIKEVIQYYRNKNSNVYLVLLDASEAFDQVGYVKLFQLLLKRGMCPIITRFLLSIYTNQTLCVRWSNIYSSTLEVSNGVK